MNSPTQEKWNECLQFFKDNVQEAAYNSWFVPIIPLDFKENALTIQVPSHFYYEQLEDKYIDLIQQALYRYFGKGVQLMYQVVIESEKRTTFDIEGASASSAVKRPAGKSALQVISPFNQPVFEELEPHLNPNYTFNNFCKGESNMLARTAGEQIAQEPGTTPFNPFFIHGASGVGKTHLINAIGVAIKEMYPSKRILYISSHLFQVQYTNAVRSNTVNDFINFYQSIDVLLIDDIHELAGKTQTQNTFFHIFNHLHLNKKQLIMTSDRSPASLDGVEPRLLTRFKWGLTAELEVPDFELRRSILANKVKHDGLDISSDVIEYIAHNVSDSVRDLEGTLVTLIARATIFNREITIDLAEKVLNTTSFSEKKKITVDKIKEVVCNYFEVDAKLFSSNTRKRDIAQPRQIAMFLSRKLTETSIVRIGELIGKRDHATVHHACKTIGEQITIDKVMRRNIEEIEKLLQQQ